MGFLRAVFSAALFTLFLSVDAGANDITLTSRDGSIALLGTLVGYDGEYYRIDTEYGVLTVDGSGVICDGPGCPDLNTFVARFTFSGAYELGAGLVPALIESFAAQRGYVLQSQALPETGMRFTLFEAGPEGTKAAEITLLTSTSSQGIQNLINGKADFALTLREATQDEAIAADKAGLGRLTSLRQARVLALDAMVPLVARGNPISHLTLEQLAGIFAGKITNWAQVGGEDAPITAYLPVENAGLSNLFTNQIMQLWADDQVSNSVIRLGTNADVVQAVLRDPFGIGIGQFSQPGDAKIITLSGECGFEVAASISSIKAEDYPLTAPFYLYLAARRLPKIGREYLQFLRTDTAQFVVRDSGLVNQLVEETSVEEQGRRLANAILAAGDGSGFEQLKYMASLMMGHTRLSTTFRFRDGSSQLDAASISNVLLLADALEAGRYDGRSVRFVGFADGQGDASINQRLALKRAQVVLRAVREAAATLDEERVELSVETLGEALPMACDDSTWGRQVNRRVEIWVQDRTD